MRLSPSLALALALALALGALLALSAGCADSTGPPPPAAAPPLAEPAAPPQPGLRAFPPLSRPGDVYDGNPGIYQAARAYHGGTLASRYVLYEDGTFGLQFLSPAFGFHEYAGRYAHRQPGISLGFYDGNTAGPWFATATLRGDSLAVEYNLVMYLADFLDGVYVRSPPSD